MNIIPLRLKTTNGITVQAEDYSAHGIENPYRLTAFIPTHEGKQKYRTVQFTFGSMKAAMDACYDLAYSGNKLKDYTSKLTEPENERYIRNL